MNESPQARVARTIEALERARKQWESGEIGQRVYLAYERSQTRVIERWFNRLMGSELTEMAAVLLAYQSWVNRDSPKWRETGNGGWRRD
jgi:hypothetical protein